MITGAIENIAQANNACAYVSWTAAPHVQNVTSYIVSYYLDGDPTHVAQSTSTNTSTKISGLYPGKLYWFMVQSRNSLGVVSPPVPYQSCLMPIDNVAPNTPTSLVAVASLRGAQLTCDANTEPDLMGYLFQVSVGQGPFVPINTAPQLSNSLNYQAPPGTPVGTMLSFIVAAQDWSGNISPWSVATDQALEVTNTGGLPFDEIVTGNLSVLGTVVAGGGLQTAQTGQRVTVDETGVTLYDGSQNDYGAGVGVTVKLSAQSGNGFFSGVLAAGSILTGGIQSGAGQNVPVIPAGFTGFQLDATYGMRFFNGGIMTAQFATTGEIDIYSGANLNAQGGTITGATLVAGVLSGPPGVLPSAVFDLTGVPSIVFNDATGTERLRLGQYVSSVDGSTQYGLQGKDATGYVTVDTQPQHAWTAAIDQSLNRKFGLTQPAAPSVGAATNAATLTVVSTITFASNGFLIAQADPSTNSNPWLVLAYTGTTSTTFTGVIQVAGAVTTWASNTTLNIIQGYRNGAYRRNVQLTAYVQTSATADVATVEAVATLGGGTPKRLGAIGVNAAGAISQALQFACPFSVDPNGYYGVLTTTAGSGATVGPGGSGTRWAEIDF